MTSASEFQSGVAYAKGFMLTESSFDKSARYWWFGRKRNSREILAKTLM